MDIIILNNFAHSATQDYWYLCFFFYQTTKSGVFQMLGFQLVVWLQQ